MFVILRTLNKGAYSVPIYRIDSLTEMVSGRKEGCYEPERYTRVNLRDEEPLYVDVTIEELTKRLNKR